VASEVEEVVFWATEMLSRAIWAIGRDLGEERQEEYQEDRSGMRGGVGVVVVVVVSSAADVRAVASLRCCAGASFCRPVVSAEDGSIGLGFDFFRFGAAILLNRASVGFPNVGITTCI